MLTLSKSSHASLTDFSARQSAGLSSGLSNRNSTMLKGLERLSFQGRSSASQGEGSLSAASSSARRVSRLLVLRGESVTARQIAGDDISSPIPTKGMHTGGTWEFFSNSRFRFTPRGLGIIARTDLFPIVGTYRAARNRISFSGTRSSRTLVSLDVASVRGAIFVRGGKLQATVSQRVESYVAVYNGDKLLTNVADRTFRVNIRNMRKIG